MKRKIAFSFVALLAMVSTSFAGLGMRYDAVIFDNGLVQFSIYALGTEGDKPSVIDGICVQGGQGVHNVAMPSAGVSATVFDTDWCEPLMDPALKEYDTHFITPPGGYIKLGPAPTETIVAWNPAGLPEMNAYGLPYLSGTGTLSSAQDTALGFAADPSGQTYVLQAVTTFSDAWYGNCVLTGFIRAGGIDECIQIPLRIGPEPGTVAMLVFGGLCLVGIRLRKKIFSNR